MRCRIHAEMHPISNGKGHHSDEGGRTGSGTIIIDEVIGDSPGLLHISFWHPKDTTIVPPRTIRLGRAEGRAIRANLL